MTTRTINYRPRQLVKSFHKRKERFAVIVAHRRFGKTVAAINDLIKTALHDGEWCSGDPLCIDRVVDISLTASLASCHNCTLLPETSCESFNCFLDRGLLFGTDRYPEIAFFKKNI